MTDPQDGNRLEELRFAKKQQWSIAAAALTLLGAIFGAAHTMAPLGNWEKAGAELLVALIAIAGSVQLLFLQNHLARTRRLIDEKDENAWWRGTSILYSLVAALVISAFVVGYYVLWRSASTCPHAA